MNNFLELISKLINEHNEKKEKLRKDLHKSDFVSTYSKDYQNEYSENERNKIKNEIMTKVKDLAIKIRKGIESISEKRNKIFYPALSSENNRTAGEMQYQDAKALINNTKFDRTGYNRIIEEIQNSIKIKRVDFVSTIFDQIGEFSSNSNSNDHDFLKFKESIEGLKSDFVNSLNGSSIQEEIQDLEESTSKIKRFVYELKQNTEYIWLPDTKSKDINDQMKFAEQTEGVVMHGITLEGLCE